MTNVRMTRSKRIRNKDNDSKKDEEKDRQTHNVEDKHKEEEDDKKGVQKNG